MNSTHRGRQLHFLPGEVCFILSPLNGSELSRRELYNEVRRRINDEFPRLRKEFERARENSAFADDLSLDQIDKYLTTGSELLLPLNPPIRRTQGLEMPQPHVVFTASDARTTPLAYEFYRLNETDDPVVAVRQLTNLVNMLPVNSTLNRALSDLRCTVIAATPNWLNAAAQDFTDGGPGARPEPSTLDYDCWDFGSNSRLTQELTKNLNAEMRSPVLVAVLDTSPTDQQVRDAADLRKENRLLQKITTNGKVFVDDPLSIDPAYFEDRLPAIVVEWNEAHPNDELLEIPDHGLFAAGIINDITDGSTQEKVQVDVQVHLIRVLSDFGVGDLWALSWVLSKLPDRFLRRDERTRLVINMSLMTSVPPGVSVETRSPHGSYPVSLDFLEFWLPQTTNAHRRNINSLLAALRNEPDVAQALSRVHASVQHVVQWLGGKGPSTEPVFSDCDQMRMLIVAAAGNDAFIRRGPKKEDPPPPRLPARYDEVFGVAAVNRGRTGAGYSNQGDEIDVKDGIAVFGGDAAKRGSGPPRIEIPAHERPDAVIGVWSADAFPFKPEHGSNGQLEDRTNHTGWALWAGTSFATPVISAIAASLWSIDNAKPPRGPGGIMELIRDCGRQSGVTPVLGCPVIVADQV